jgi:hypothetical protein
LGEDAAARLKLRRILQTVTDMQPLLLVTNRTIQIEGNHLKDILVEKGGWGLIIYEERS